MTGVNETGMINFSFSIYELEYFLLIFTRITCFIFMIPFFNMGSTPARVRIGLGFFLSVILYQIMTPSKAVIYRSVTEYAVIIMKEAVTGLLLGFSTNISTSIIHFAGSIIDMETGLSMATLMDPATKQVTSITGVLYQQVVMLLLIVSGMYEYILRALVEAFTLIPVNGAVFHTDALLTSMLRFMGDYILIGFRICLPVFCVILLLNAILAVLAKVSPQLNMFAVGIQIKILVGLSAMFLSVRMIPGISDAVFVEVKKMMVAFVEGMM